MLDVRSLLVAEKVLMTRKTWPACCGDDRCHACNKRRIRKVRPTHVNLDTVRHTGISQDSVHRIVHDHLKFQKVCARWLSKQLMSDEQATRMMASLDNLQKHCWRGS